MKPYSLEVKSFDKQWWSEFRQQEVDAILTLTAKKNADYTGGNSCNSPIANFDQSVEFGVPPLTGICIRMQDKFQRAKSLCADGTLAVESIGDQDKDIFRDLIGYSLIALGMLERGK